MQVLLYTAYVFNTFSHMLLFISLVSNDGKERKENMEIQEEEVTELERAPAMCNTGM